jgi:hypothetical protein
MCSISCRVKEAAAGFSDPESCWNWPLSKNVQTGYGQLSTWVNGQRKLLTAHRSSYEAFKGLIDDGLFVLHKCDNPACFNPHHLSLGTQQENMEDAMAKGRFIPVKPAKINWQILHPERVPRGPTYKPRSLPKGSQNHNAKLTEAQALEVIASQETLAELSKRYGLSQSSLSAIKTGKTWRHIRPAPMADA